MPQMLRLSQRHWLNLAQIIAVRDTADGLCVWTTDGDRKPTRLTGEERLALLVWLEQHSQVWRIAPPVNDDERPF